MPELDLTEFERRVLLRPLRVDDFEALVEMHLACFPGM
jgi:hypothetical protein